MEDGHAEVLESCLHGRQRLNQGDTRGVPGIGRIFAGHTPHPPAELSNRQGAALTMANMAFQTGSPMSPLEDGRVRLHDQTTDAPFGAHAEPEQAAPRG